MQWSNRLFFRALHRWLVFNSLVGLAAALTALILAYVFAGEIYNYKDTVDINQLPPVDAIVCLAGGRGRIATAGDLWYRYWQKAQESTSFRKIPVLYISGMGPQAKWSVLSKQLRGGVLQTLRPENVMIEKESSNTDSNARWLARYVSEKNWKRILLLTSSYHMRRALFIFDHVFNNLGTPVQVETFSVYQEPFGAEEWRTDPNGARVTVLEYIKWLYYSAIWRHH